jgi:hypothetical protein
MEEERGKEEERHILSVVTGNYQRCERHQTTATSCAAQRQWNQFQQTEHIAGLRKICRQNQVQRNDYILGFRKPCNLWNNPLQIVQW